jgi:acyl-coenzyme A thioesterase PaaI-like protein
MRETVESGAIETPVSRLRETIFIRLWAFRHVPLLFFLRPSVEEFTSERVVVRIRLRRRSSNHLGSMYFGALCAGADCAGGLIAMRTILRRKAKVSLIFRNFQAEFLRRAEGDVHFTCADGQALRDLVDRAIETDERVEMPVQVTATVPSLLGDEPVARFTLTISLRRRD